MGRVAQPARAGRRPAWLLAGLAAAALATAGLALGGALWPGYDPVAQTVSELVARGAPHRAAMIGVFVVYNALLIGFGRGLQRRARTCGPGGAWGVRGGGRVVALGALGLALLALPKDPTGAARTAVGTAHLVLAGGMAALSAAAALSCGLWWRTQPGCGRLSALSLACGGVAVALAAATGVAMAYGVAAGLFERLLIGSYLVWMGAVSYELGVKNEA